MELIKLKPEHLKELYDIRFSVTENLVHAHQTGYLQREQALEDISQDGGWICRINDEFVGYGLGIYIPHALIGGLFVRPEYQGRKVGSLILTEVTNWFFSRGTYEIELTTDADSAAVNFYEKNGWVKAGFDEFGQRVMKRKKRDDE